MQGGGLTFEFEDSILGNDALLCQRRERSLLLIDQVELGLGGPLSPFKSDDLLFTAGNLLLYEGDARLMRRFPRVEKRRLLIDEGPDLGIVAGGLLELLRKGNFLGGTDLRHQASALGQKLKASGAKYGKFGRNV